MFNGGSFVGFDWGKRFRQLGIGFRFCLRAVGRAVVQALMRALSCSGGIRECAGHISAVMRARIMSCCTGLRRWSCQEVGRWVAGSVLIKCARAGRPSMAMIGMRRRCSWSSRVSCASARKLFFFSARWGWGSERGRGLEGRAITSTRGRKNGILILGRR